jgi:uncharacterized lipoprotein YmbA
MPALLTRSELIVRSGPTEVTLLENEQWASPLSDEIRDAVRVELQNRSAQTTDSAPGRPFAKLSVAIDIERLETELGRYALIEATWTASSATDALNKLIVKSCPFRDYEAIGGGYTEIVRGYQRELKALADTIILALVSTSDDRAPCQKLATQENNKGIS